MTAERLKLFGELYIEFVKRCEHICHNLLKDLDDYVFMSKFKLDSSFNEVDCWPAPGMLCECEEYYESFPADFIYKSDEEILRWKEEILEKRRKEKEENEELKQHRELVDEYQKYLELKRKFENS